MGSDAFIHVLLTKSEAAAASKAGVSLHQGASITCVPKHVPVRGRKLYTAWLDMGTGDAWPCIRRPWLIALYRWLGAGADADADADIRKCLSKTCPLNTHISYIDDFKSSSAYVRLLDIFVSKNVPALKYLFSMMCSRGLLDDVSVLVPCLRAMLDQLQPFLPRTLKDLEDTPWQTSSEDENTVSWCKDEKYFAFIVQHHAHLVSPLLYT